MAIAIVAAAAIGDPRDDKVRHGPPFAFSGRGNERSRSSETAAEFRDHDRQPVLRRLVNQAAGSK